MIDDGFRKITVNHFASGEDGIPAKDFIELAIFEKAKIKIACHEGTSTEINVPEGAPSHVAGRDLLFGYDKIFKLSMGNGKIDYLLFSEQGIYAFLS